MEYRELLFIIGIVSAVALSGFFLFSSPAFTGSAVMDIKDSYKIGEKISGEVIIENKEIKENSAFLV